MWTHGPRCCVLCVAFASMACNDRSTAVVDEDADVGVHPPHDLSSSDTRDAGLPPGSPCVKDYECSVGLCCGEPGKKICVTGDRCPDSGHKILFLIDTSAAAQELDPSGYRRKAVDRVLSRLGKTPDYHFGVISFAGEARTLIEGGFTQDSNALSAAAQAVQGDGNCLKGSCRDYRGAISMASRVIGDDIAALDPELRSKTSYTIVMFAVGPPVPAVDRCACRDKKTEVLAANWQSCPWTECDGCKVTCPPHTVCQDSLCYPLCSPECASNEFCDVDFLCKEGQPTNPPNLPPISSLPATMPDTFITWVLPAQHHLDESKISPMNAGDTAGPCQLSCVFYRDSDGTEQGNTSSCEERVLVDAVREIKELATNNNAAELRFHVLYLPDNQDYSTKPGDPFAPLCSDPVADQARTRRLLVEMSFGHGQFLELDADAPETISFDGLPL